MMKLRAFPLMLLMAACANTTPVATLSAEFADPSAHATSNPLLETDTIGAVVSLLDQSTSVQAASEPVAQPTPTEWEQEKAQLRREIEQLNKRVKQLENRPKTPPPPPKRPTKKHSHHTHQPALVSPKPEPVMPPPSLDDIQEVPTLAEIAPITSHNDVYGQAKKLYQQKKFQQVAQLLRHADGGGDGSESARKQMYLLLLSHQKLKNCQSVIGIGQRLTGQFSGSHEASEAQFMVGQCQWNIQQRDIAKDTWRKLIASQPNTAAAKRAKIALQQK